MLIFLVVSVLTSRIAYAADCSSVLPTTARTCQLLNPDAQLELRLNISHKLQVIYRGVLVPFNNTLRQDPHYNSMNHSDFGDTYNPTVSISDYKVMGKAGWVIQKCYFPILANITIAEFGKKMSCPGSNEYSNQSLSLLISLPPLVTMLQKLAKTDSRVTPKDGCNVNSDPICLEPDYPNTRSADGLQFTEDQERIRNNFGLVNTLMHYFNDLSRNAYLAL